MLEKVLEEYKATLLFNAERPESQLSLATLYSNMQMPKKAEEAYKEALRLQPMFVPIYINYSSFLQKQGKEKEVFEILQQGVATVPSMGILHHTLGLWYIRNKEKTKAIEALKKAVELAPDDTRFSYVYAVAVGEKNPAEAIKILEAVYPKHSGDIQIVSGLAYYYKMTGDPAKSEEYNKKVKALQNFSVR